jgi:hypothetical protein
LAGSGRARRAAGVRLANGPSRDRPGARAGSDRLDRRRSGYARGLDCKATRIRTDAFADRAFQICGSFRPAAPGPWRPRPDDDGDLFDPIALCATLPGAPR